MVKDQVLLRSAVWRRLRGAGVVMEAETFTAAPRAIACTARPEHVLRALDGALLTAAESRRVAALRHPVDRDAYVAAHLLARWCAAALTRRPIESLGMEQRCPDCGSGEHGKPELRGLPDVHVSLSRTRQAVAAVAGWDAVAVDVDSASGDVLAAMPVALSAAERKQVLGAPDRRGAFLRHWVRKECLVKVGATTLDTMGRVDLTEVRETIGSDGRTRSRYHDVHMVHWSDSSLGVTIAVAGAEYPEIHPFPVVRD